MQIYVLPLYFCFQQLLNIMFHKAPSPTLIKSVNICICKNMQTIYYVYIKIFILYLDTMCVCYSIKKTCEVYMSTSIFLLHQNETRVIMHIELGVGLI